MPAMSSRAPDGAPAAARAAWRLPALLPGVVSGAALQLLQPRLWPPLGFGGLLGGGWRAAGCGVGRGAAVVAASAVAAPGVRGLAVRCVGIGLVRWCGGN